MTNKKLIVLLWTICITSICYSQSIFISSFRLLDTDLTANTAGTMEIDQNGETAALIKVVTTQTGFTFDGGSLGIVKTVPKPSEIWVYVPHGTKKITISHPVMGILRDHYFNIPIESGRTYEMILKAEMALELNGDKKEYYNSRFGFTVEYPAIMHRAMGSRNNDGTHFTYQDITFTAAGHYDVWDRDPNSSTKEYVAYVMNELIDNAIYKESFDNYYIVKTVNDKLFRYEKAILYDNEDDSPTWVHLYLDYPEDKETMVEPLIQYIKNYNQVKLKPSF